jgi:hypothetical protein
LTDYYWATKITNYADFPQSENVTESCDWRKIGWSTTP